MTLLDHCHSRISPYSWVGVPPPRVIAGPQFDRLHAHLGQPVEHLFERQVAVGNGEDAEPQLAASSRTAGTSTQPPSSALRRIASIASVTACASANVATVPAGAAGSRMLE